MFNSVSMTRLAAGIAYASGVQAPSEADRIIPQVKALVDTRLDGKAGRILIYNPDAISMWLVQKYTEDFAPVMARTDLTVPVASVMPAVTPVCFGTMYTGAAPEIHGIRKYEKPVIGTDSLFDALSRGKRRVALVAVADSSMALIFAGRDIDYYLLPYDADVNREALRLIDEDKHDVIVVYNQEYDDVMHETTPESRESLAAMRRHIEAFATLADAAKAAWKGRKTLVCWASDHGIHTNEAGYGDHGEYIEEDINVFHFYGAYNG